MMFFDIERNVFLIEGIDDIPSNAIPVDEQSSGEIMRKIELGAVVSVDEGKLIVSSVRPSEIHQWDGSKWEVNEEKFLEYRALQIDQLKAKINALRDEKSAGGCYVESLGKWFDSDQAAYNNLLGFKAETDLNGEKTTYWACADNSLIEFDREKLKTVISTLWDVKTANHATALKHKAMLEQAETPEDYDYSTGWVKSYADFLKEQKNDV